MPSAALLSFARRFLIACVVVAVLAGAGFLAGNAFARHTFEQSRTVSVPSLVRVDPGQPANYLLIGSDSRQVGDPAFSGQNVQGQRSDVMMVLHVEPASKTGILVSFPRDLVVDIPGHGRNLLNAAFSFGGADLVVSTLQSAFPPLKINHYIEVDFKGFEDVVNAIGHIPLWFPTPVHDPYSGLNVDKAGCVSADGTMALEYARSRHYYVPDDVANPAPWQWNYDPGIPESAYRGGRGWSATGSDLDRIPRQQYFLRTISQYAISKTASDPTKLFALLHAVQSNFKRDTTLKYDELKALVNTFRTLSPSKVQMQTLPVTEITSGPFSQHLVATDAALTVAQRLMDFGKTASPPLPKPLPPAQVEVRIVNGSGVAGAAIGPANDFRAAGFHVVGAPADADRGDYLQTQIRYAPGKYAEAVTVAPAVGSLNLVAAISRQNTLGADVLVIVGRDYGRLQHGFAAIERAGNTTSSVSPRPSTSSSLSLSSPPPTSTTTTSSTTTSTTTTSIPNAVDAGLVPVDPKTGGPLVGCPS